MNLSLLITVVVKDLPLDTCRQIIFGEDVSFCSPLLVVHWRGKTHFGFARLKQNAAVESLDCSPPESEGLYR